MALGFRQRLPARCGAVAVAAGAAFAGGAVGACSTPGDSLQSTPETLLVRVDVPLREPVWSYREHALIALTDDGRLAGVDRAGDPDGARTRLSAPLGAGRNVQISSVDDRRVFVPQPSQQRVAIIDLADLRRVDAIDAGPAPSYLSEDAGMGVLLALSADGSTVTPVDEHGYRRMRSAHLDGGPAHLIDGSARGRAIEYHAFGPSGIQFYKGPSAPPEHRGGFDANIVVAAGDNTKVTRSYVADAARDTLYAIDSGRNEYGLREVGRVETAAPIRYLGTDATRIYAGTDRELLVFETSSFTGYRDGAIAPLHAVDYRVVLPDGPLAAAPLSGMAIGPDRVYLTFQHQPAVLSIAKPRL